MILALDTTSEFGSIALVSPDAVVEEILLHSPEGFGHILYEHITRLLARNVTPLEQIDCFAAASGPGSFTGVRVGLAAVKGLAEATAKPAIAVSNLQALAFHGTASLRAAVIDARRGEVYGGLYDAALNAIAPEIVTPFPAWLANLPSGEIEFVSVDFTPFQAAVSGTRFADAPVTAAPRALAGAVGLIAQQRFARGQATDPAAIDANYVRRSDAELLWKDK